MSTVTTIFAGAALAATLVTTACSSSGGGTAATQPPSAPSTGAPAPVTSHVRATQTAIEIETQHGPLGTYLTDGKGMTLYMFASDSATKSSCSGQCLQFWPLVRGPAVARHGAKQSDLATITTDGQKQVTYKGHPLYYFAEDKAPGQTTGQGSNGFGAKWWVLTPGGTPITAAAPSSAAATTEDNGGGSGNGYGGK